MQWGNEAARQRYRDVVDSAHGCIIGLDYDGTLAPIVDDPREAWIHPAMPALLKNLCRTTRTVAIITGRPAHQAIMLGGFDDLANDCPNLIVLGHYGNEHWSSTDRRVVAPPVPSGISGFVRHLPGLIRALDLEPWVEEKGIAVAVHCRRLADPPGAYATLLPPLTKLAADHGLVIEPGRLVIEARAPGMDKGIALRTLIDRIHPTAVVFAGDDRGDLLAFEELARLDRAGLPTLRLCSGSPEEPRLADEADVILDGPDGIAAFLQAFLDTANSI